MVTGPLYFWTQWPHDPNLTINVLLQVVLSHFQNLKQLSRPLPKQVFEEVELGFLVVGHTHKDIDALFGNIGKWLKKNNALTVPELIERHASCTDDIPEISIAIPLKVEYFLKWIASGVVHLMGTIPPWET
ncbi:hypothetical protein EMCRGX_G016659 [Ephydatia muelleri]